MKVINTSFILGARLFRNFQDIYIVSIIFGKVLFEVHIVYNQDLNGRITHHYFYKISICDRKLLSENFEERPDFFCLFISQESCYAFFSDNPFSRRGENFSFLIFNKNFVLDWVKSIKKICVVLILFQNI